MKKLFSLKRLMARILPPLALVLGLAGCYLRQWPVTPTVADGSTYEVRTPSLQGTAWVVADGYLFTAGHVCLGALDGNVWLRGSSGRLVPAKPVLIEITQGPEGDACLLKTDGPLARPLVLAWDMPQVGAVVGAVGYKYGVHTITAGTYLGNGESKVTSGHGMSGGPMFTAKGVYSLVTQGCAADVEDETCTAGPTVIELRSMLNEMGVTPTNPPDRVPEPDEVFPGTRG